ncbi:MAG: methyltransferase domain-containing protein [Thermoanaerobaculaceae bacterium]|nr:methyltransferase domain-containing protein [Thermoanaerobaculaceae bacterium]
MSDGHPPAGAAGTPPQPQRGRQGWLLRLLRRAARAVLWPELERIDGDLAAATALAGGVQREAAGTTELQRRLDARLDREAAAIVDLREAYLLTRSEFEEVRDRRLLQLADGVDGASKAAAAVQREVESLRDTRVPAGEAALAGLQRAAEALQREVESLRDTRLPQAEAGIERLQRAIDAAPATIAGVQALAEELRDRRLPALAARTDALVERLHEELAEVAGLAERVARHEPLHVAVAPDVEARIPAAVAAASRAFADEFRGERGEILGRAAEHVRLLGTAAPVLDLGCGRGELLEALRDAGVEARGVDADPAMVAACRRLALTVEEDEAIAALRASAPGSLGAVTAIHIVEHLPAAGWMALVEAAAAALRPGGILMIESPNPESLRVGAGLFWLDPTHRAPVHPEALAFVVRALGLEVVETRFLHPFPPDQALAAPSQPEAVRELAAKLDGWLSAPRDYLLVARKP